MSYTKQEFVSGQILKAEHLNYMEDGIGQLSEEIGEQGKAIERLSSSDAIPEYWEDYLVEKISRIKELQRTGGKDCYSFVVLTDFHHSTKRNNYSPKLIEKIMDECGIKFCLCLGDIQNGGAWGTKEQELADWDGIDKLFSPIKDRTLMIPGNHDGAYGSADMNGDGKIEGVTDYYIYNLSPDEVYELVCRKVSLINGIKFDAEKFGYYIDEPVSKVRYILVNAQYSDGAVNEDGTPVNNYMRKVRVGQSQMNMVIDALQTMPDAGWHAVIGAHFPLVRIGSEGGGGDLFLLRELLEAYQNKTTYAKTFGTSGDYDYVSVDVDFTQAKGSVLGAFGGHVHRDGYDGSYAFPIITSAPDNTNDMWMNGEAVSGEIGTITEQSFDVFTVDRRAGLFYATKIGFGEERMFAIGESYSVTLHVDGVNVSNTDTVVVKNAPYHNVITANAGNLINSVTVTMGGVDVTSEVYADGVINIDNVTGEIVIAVVITYAYTNLADISSPDWHSEEGYLDIYSGAFVEGDSTYYNESVFVTNFIPVKKGDILRIKGFDREEYVVGSPPRISFYDENKEYITKLYTTSVNADKSDGFTSAVSAAFDETGILEYEIMIRGDTGEQFVYNNFCDRAKYIRVNTHWLTSEDDIIITVNEEIV